MYTSESHNTKHNTSLNFKSKNINFIAVYNVITETSSI